MLDMYYDGSDTVIAESSEDCEINKTDEDDSYVSVKATKEKWIEAHGRGFFCTENW